MWCHDGEGELLLAIGSMPVYLANMRPASRLRSSSPVVPCFECDPPEPKPHTAQGIIRQGSSSFCWVSDAASHPSCCGIADKPPMGEINMASAGFKSSRCRNEKNGAGGVPDSPSRLQIQLSNTVNESDDEDAQNNRLA